MPSVDRVLGTPASASLIEQFGRCAVLASVRQILDELRAGTLILPDGAEAIAATCQDRLNANTAPSLRPVFNLTGTLLHTNLGRALLPKEACAAVSAMLSQACNLEFDLGTGTRGDRDDHLEALICELTGAEAATIVNNNAAAVLLVVNTLALGKEVIVSRGELVEIGGSFRIPEVMQRAGAILREVGTTNRTHLPDFAGAIGTQSGLVLKVHTSNYAIQGFTASVPESELAKLGRERGIPFAVDLGSGTLLDLTRWGLPREPTVRETLAHADLVTFSGDKLLGGVQCGFIVGTRGLVDAVKRNPLKRALRVGKMTIAALEAVLRLYRHPERLGETLPTLRLLARTPEDIHEAAERLLPHLARAVGTHAAVSIVSCASQVGSGALPVEILPSFALALGPPVSGCRTGGWLERVSTAFRSLPVPVIGRITAETFQLDLRPLDDEARFIGQLPDLALAHFSC